MANHYSTLCVKCSQRYSPPAFWCDHCQITIPPTYEIDDEIKKTIEKLNVELYKTGSILDNFKSLSESNTIPSIEYNIVLSIIKKIQNNLKTRISYESIIKYNFHEIRYLLIQASCDMDPIPRIQKWHTEHKRNLTPALEKALVDLCNRFNDRKKGKENEPKESGSQNPPDTPPSENIGQPTTCREPSENQALLGNPGQSKEESVPGFLGQEVKPAPLPKEANESILLNSTEEIRSRKVRHSDNQPSPPTETDDRSGEVYPFILQTTQPLQSDIKSTEPANTSEPTGATTTLPSRSPLDSLSGFQVVGKEEFSLRSIQPARLGPPIATFFGSMKEGVLWGWKATWWRKIPKWNQALKPFLFDNIGWFIGGFLILAGFSYLIATLWNTLGQNPIWWRSLVFASLFGSTVAFSSLGHYLLKKHPHLELSGMVFLTLGSLLFPMVMATSMMIATLPPNPVNEAVPQPETKFQVIP